MVHTSSNSESPTWSLTEDLLMSSLWTSPMPKLSPQAQFYVEEAPCLVEFDVWL